MALMPKRGGDYVTLGACRVCAACAAVSKPPVRSFPSLTIVLSSGLYLVSGTVPAWPFAVRSTVAVGSLSFSVPPILDFRFRYQTPFRAERPEQGRWRTTEDPRQPRFPCTGTSSPGSYRRRR
ncbi:hypothetical protein BD309DRAFT_440425 [Dichomitus squalens]|nr:hypothetical protein BD309DRAFT_440425 [Dichomitus squalens]